MEELNKEIRQALWCSQSTLATLEKRVSVLTTSPIATDTPEPPMPAVIPVFTSSGIGKIPDCTLKDETAFFQLPRYRQVCVTGKPNPQQTFTPTKNELGSLVRHLHKRDDLFTWKHDKTGCFARATLMNQFLKVMGVPDQNIAKVYLRAPQQKNGWRYHVAILVTAKDKKSYVLDPALDPTKALTEQEWMELQLPGTIASSVQNAGRCSEDLTYDPDKGILLTLDQDKMLVNVDPLDGHLHMEKEEDGDRASDFVDLAEYRKKS